MTTTAPSAWRRLTDDVDLLLRETLGPVLDAELPRQGARHAFVVATDQQDSADAERPQPAQRVGDLRAEGVGDADEADEALALGQVHDRATLPLERVGPVPL
jgi:hypothetical protein